MSSGRSSPTGRVAGRPRAPSTLCTPSWNAAISVEATIVGSRRTAGARSPAASVIIASDSAPGRSSSAAGEPSAGMMWWASSMISQCGRPVVERTVVITASTVVA